MSLHRHAVMLKFDLVILLTAFAPAAGILNQESISSPTKELPVDDASAQVFNEWKATYKKTFKSAEDEQKAMKTLIRNKKEIELHNIRFKAGMETYSRGLWEMSDLSFEETSSVLAASTFNFSIQQLQGPTKKLQNAPAEVNWVKAGRVNSVENQARCGSCFAYAAVGAAEGVLLKKGINTRLSVQQIVDCDKLNDGCDGLW